jgi:alcohol dehydrogenase class IV/protocatechuate 3,4-dioxygenase beta subunit
MEAFVHTAGPARVVFGSGTIDQLRAETERLGRSRAFLVAGPGRGEAVERARKALGPVAVGGFEGAAMHTPVEVTRRAWERLRAYDVDCLVSIGGGSATGLGKALSIRTGLPHIAVPTTYAGSEVTPTLGETDGADKSTRSDPAILPDAVVYDVDLTLGLPVALSVHSGVNAMAHAVEALYSPGANPVSDALAVEAITRISRALPMIADNPSTVDARADALLGAWLAGICLGTVGMGLHHKLCHVLGGTFGLPHAPTHTVVLPHVMAYNEPAAPEAMDRVARALGRKTAAPQAIYDLIVALDGPTSLRELGLAGADLPRVAELAGRQPYPNPRSLDGIDALLHETWSGHRPVAAAPEVPDFGWLTDEVLRSFDQTPDPRVRRLVTDLVRRLHAYANDNDLSTAEWQYGIDFLTRAGQITSPTRQEFVLLSDTLGVSSMVDLLANSRTPDTTPSAVLGPFYVDGPPGTPLGDDISGGLPGTPLWTDVSIVDTSGTPVAGATVDVWQSNQDGFYDVQLPDLEGPVLRARFHSDRDGRVHFWSILPSEYPIPDDGPVGQMLAGTGRHPYRAPHLHFMINAPGYHRLVTQLFVAGGAYLDSDTVFGVKNELIVDFEPGVGTPPDGRQVEEWRRLTYTFRVGPTGLQPMG